MPSSVIRSFSYDAPSQTLAIRFTSGRRYRYYEVLASLFEDMKGAFSKGEFFNARVKDRFRYSHDGWFHSAEAGRPILR